MMRKWRIIVRFSQNAYFLFKITKDKTELTLKHYIIPPNKQLGNLGGQFLESMEKTEKYECEICLIHFPKSENTSCLSPTSLNSKTLVLARSLSQLHRFPLNLLTCCFKMQKLLLWRQYEGKSLLKMLKFIFRSGISVSVLYSWPLTLELNLSEFILVMQFISVLTEHLVWVEKGAGIERQILTYCLLTWESAFGRKQEAYDLNYNSDADLRFYLLNHKLRKLDKMYVYA